MTGNLSSLLWARPVKRFTATLAALLFVPASPVFSEASDYEVDGLLLPQNARPAVDDISPFAGTWIGRWDGVLKTILIVESVAENGEAKVIYSIADNPSAGFERAWFRLDAMVNGSDMVISGSGFSLGVKASPTGRLRAVFGDGISFAILSRRELASLIQPGAQIEWELGTSEMVRTELFEDGKPIDLEIVMIRPEGDGPFPLAVVNHGSTGTGTNTQAFLDTWTNEWFADVLNQFGWIVAFPQRRGRGKSHGLYDEGFGTNRSLGYTCDTEPSLGGADRALEDLHAAILSLRQRPDVGDEPVLVAGQSRGGILSVAYAGFHPEMTGGVINFAGGWMGEFCKTAGTINQTLARKGAGFKRPMLWIYGHDDVYYSIAHSRKTFEAFIQAGGSGRFEEVTVRGENNGHWAMAIPPLWSTHVERYLADMAEAAN
ncbi:MAG: hypothetical protein ABJN75_16495 [Hoeflea sp.]|uniref:alpha/beta hydrolase family protein n=1 Tax=Hoeflea sp. TaxID=1940281 RepID=UPI00329A7AD3